MTPELIGILTVGVALAGVVLVTLRENTRVLRTEIKAVREEVHAEIKAVREETNRQFEAVHAEIKAVREETNKQFAAVHAEIAAMRADMAELRERMARIEGMFEGFLRREREPTAAAAE